MGPTKLRLSTIKRFFVTFYADITDPDGITDVDSVTLNLSDISTDLAIQAMSLTDEEAGHFEAVITHPCRHCPAGLCSVPVTALDNSGFTDVKTIEFEVKRKSIDGL